MSKELDYLQLSDAALLAQCDVHTYRSSGPGGQHRNKVSSAVRLRHQPTGISAHGDDSRSQHENKAMALRRLRMNFALQLRHPVDKVAGDIPAIVRECLFVPRGKGPVGRALPAGSHVGIVGRARPADTRVESVGRALPADAHAHKDGGQCPPYATKRLQVGRKDYRFWPAAAFLLDVLEAFEGRLSDAAAWLGVTTSNLVSVFQDDRHLLAAAQQIRKAHGHGPVK